MAAIAERVIPEIQNIANSMSSTGHRVTESSLYPNSQENRESASGPKMKIAEKDSRSVGDLRDTTGQGSHRCLSPKCARSEFYSEPCFSFLKHCFLEGIFFTFPMIMETL